MNTNKIRLTESQLRDMISEAVKNVLNEGKYDGYFYPAYRGLPGGSRAISDKGKKVSRKTLNRIYDFDYDTRHDVPPGMTYDGPEAFNQFDANLYLHNLRKYNGKGGHDRTYYEYNQMRELRLKAMKLGVSKNIIMKLPDYLLKEIIRELSKK